MNNNKVYYHPSDRLIDIFVGASDGITVPFVVIAALYGAAFSNNIIIIIATTAAVVGGIVMFVSSYMTAKHQSEEEGRLSDTEKQIADRIGLSEEIQQQMNADAVKEHDEYSSYAKEYELTASTKPLKLIRVSAITIGVAYFIGGLITTIPFYFIADVRIAFLWCVGSTLVTLFMLSAYRAKVTEQQLLYGALRAVIMAAVAGWAAYYIAGLFL